MLKTRVGESGHDSPTSDSTSASWSRLSSTGLDELLAEVDASPSERAVCHAVLRVMGAHEESPVSRAQLARVTGYAERTITRATNWLDRHGLLDIERTRHQDDNGQWRNELNRYRPGLAVRALAPPRQHRRKTTSTHLHPTGSCCDCGGRVTSTPDGDANQRCKDCYRQHRARRPVTAGYSTTRDVGPVPVPFVGSADAVFCECCGVRGGRHRYDCDHRSDMTSQISDNYLKQRRSQTENRAGLAGIRAAREVLVR